MTTEKKAKNFYIIFGWRADLVIDELETQEAYLIKCKSPGYKSPYWEEVRKHLKKLKKDERKI